MAPLHEIDVVENHYASHEDQNVEKNQVLELHLVIDNSTQHFVVVFSFIT